MRRTVNWDVRRACAAVVFLVAAGFAGGCEELSEPLAPEVEGQVTGSVTADGAGLAGVTVTMSNGMTATTNVSGAFTFTGVDAGAYTVAISGYPSDVTFPATIQAAVVATDGQVVTLNFSGARVNLTETTTHSGTLSVAGGDSSHDEFVFDASSSRDVSLRSEVNTATREVRLTPQSGFSPSTLPELTGTVTAGGTLTASGSGTIAGVSNVSVTATGTLANGELEITITVGADGKLPGGQPIQYRYVDN